MWYILNQLSVAILLHDVYIFLIKKNLKKAAVPFIYSFGLIPKEPRKESGSNESELDLLRFFIIILC